MKYIVTRQHWGDRQYFEGDEREVKTKADADILISAGLLVGDDKTSSAKKDEKAAPKPKNKMAKEPANKSE